MTGQLNYHHLRYFLAVAEAGGITAAARRLHVSPPTLSMQVRELEEAFGRELFVREGRRMPLTETGRMVRTYAERIFRLGEEMTEVVRRGGPEGPQTVQLGLGDAVAKQHLSPLLAKALLQLPGLRVVVREGLPGELYPALAAHHLDVVLANEPPPSSLKAVLLCRRAGRFPVSLVASPALAARYRRHQSLQGFPVLLPTRESPMRRELDRQWAEQGVTPDIRAEFDDTAAMCEMAAAGAGAAPLPAPMLPAAKQHHHLRILPLRTGVQEELYVVTADREFDHEGTRIIVRLASESRQSPAPPRRSTAKNSPPEA